MLTLHGLADPQNTYDGHVEGRGGEWVESVPEALAGWAKHNGCDGEPMLDDPAGPLSTLRYEGCDAEVRLVRVDGLVHRGRATRSTRRPRCGVLPQPDACRPRANDVSQLARFATVHWLEHDGIKTATSGFCRVQRTPP